MCPLLSSSGDGEHWKWMAYLEWLEPEFQHQEGFLMIACQRPKLMQLLIVKDRTVEQLSHSGYSPILLGFYATGLRLKQTREMIINYRRLAMAWNWAVP
jgi:hypothetical protein